MDPSTCLLESIQLTEGDDCNKHQNHQLKCTSVCVLRYDFRQQYIYLQLLLSI